MSDQEQQKRSRSPLTPPHTPKRVKFEVNDTNEYRSSKHGHRIALAFSRRTRYADYDKEIDEAQDDLQEHSPGASSPRLAPVDEEYHYHNTILPAQHHKPKIYKQAQNNHVKKRKVPSTRFDKLQKPSRRKNPTSSTQALSSTSRTPLPFESRYLSLVAGYTSISPQTFTLALAPWDCRNTGDHDQKPMSEGGNSTQEAHPVSSLSLTTIEEHNLAKVWTYIYCPHILPDTTHKTLHYIVTENSSRQLMGVYAGFVSLTKTSSSAVATLHTSAKNDESGCNCHAKAILSVCKFAIEPLKLEVRLLLKERHIEEGLVEDLEETCRGEVGSGMRASVSWEEGEVTRDALGGLIAGFPVVSVD